MKLWLLRPLENLKTPNSSQRDPWDPWYDKAFGFVVRANTESEARGFADTNSGDENRGDIHPWLSSDLSTCEELHSIGEPGMIIRDFAAA